MIITDSSSNIKAIENRFCKKHYQELKASGLTDEAIISTGHYTQSKMDEGLGIKHTGMVFKYLNPVTGKHYENSEGKPWIRIKPDDWGTWDSDDEPPKYLSQSDEGNRPYFSSCLSVSQWQKIIKSSRHPLIITEGEKKSDCACLRGYNAAAGSRPRASASRSPAPTQWKPEKNRQHAAGSQSVLRSPPATGRSAAYASNPSGC